LQLHSHRHSLWPPSWSNLSLCNFIAGWASLGLILGIVAITGAIMSFEDEIARAIDGPLFAPGAPPAPDLSPDQMVVRVEAAYPGLHVDRIVWPTDRTQSVEIRPPRRERARGLKDRLTGQPGNGWVHPQPEFFATVRRLHRWLLLPGNGDGIGRSITGIAAIGLVILALTGLYLRWPYHARRWREWLVVDGNAKSGCSGAACMWSRPHGQSRSGCCRRRRACGGPIPPIARWRQRL
jgi:uncharacterized iron-regulated membrane protein